MSITAEKPGVLTSRKSAASPALTEPRIVAMPAERMAVVETVGNPEEVGKQAIQALYGAVYGLKFAQKKLGREFKVKPLRARWPGAFRKPPSQFHGIWGLPVPPLTRAVPQKVPGTPVQLQTWSYGTVAEVLHLGPYSAERPTIERLLRFIREQGYEVNGVHEEEYLSRPDAKLPRTVIRYPVKRRKGVNRARGGK
jgi:hypothetical protein